MKYAVIIPITLKEAIRFRGNVPAVNYFVQRGVATCLVLNGCSVEESTTAERLFDTLPRCFHLLYAGGKGNPYVARNVAMNYFSGYDGFLLMDSDTEPADSDYHDKLMSIAEPHKLLAGRTKTKVPEGSPHFDMLRNRFECYDGFTPPDHTVGCNMYIGSEVYRRVGPMREDVVSGGDGLYGIRYKHLGYEVTPAPQLLAYKTIYGMTLEGVLRKQITRATCYPPEMMQDIRTTINSLREALDLAASHCSPDSFRDEYPEFVDAVFKVGMRFGQLIQHVDKGYTHANPRTDAQ